MIQKHINALFADDDALFFDEHSGGIGILRVDLTNINLDDVNFYKDDLETIIHVRLMTWCNRLKQRQVFKKDRRKELMAVARHPTRW